MDVNSWMRLFLALGSSGTGAALLDRCGTAGEVYESLSDPTVMQGLPAGTAERLLEISPADAERVLCVCREMGWTVLTAADPRYPAALKSLPDYPPVLFAAGDVRVLENTRAIAVVGTRGASDAGRGVAFALGESLACNGVLTVSGCALGIDSAVMDGALNYGGPVAGVLGCGLGCPYLPGRVFFRRRVETCGVLLSEQLPFAEPSRYTFPRRNRLIAALAAGTAVVESDEKGGSLITARDAVKLRRAVFAVSPAVVPSAGCERMIRGGVTPLENTLPIRDLLREREPELPWDDVPLKPAAASPSWVAFPERMQLEDFAMISRVPVEDARGIYETYIRSGGADERPPAGKQTIPTPDVAPRNAGKRKTAPSAKQKTPVAGAPKAGAPAADPKRVPEAPATLSDDAKRIYALFTDRQETLDSLSARAGLPIRQVMVAVSQLELAGLVYSALGGGLFKTKTE